MEPIRWDTWTLRIPSTNAFNLYGIASSNSEFVTVGSTRGVSRRGVILRSINRTDCPLAKDARPALKAAMHDSDPDVRRKALEALNKIDPANSNPLNGMAELVRTH